MKWLGQRYCPESSRTLVRDGHSLGLHEGFLRKARLESRDLDLGTRLLRTAVFSATGVVAKVCFTVFGRGVFRGREKLMRAVDTYCDAERGPGLITVSNHVGTIDDPVIWGGLPWRWVVCGTQQKRWVWAAQEICFRTYPLAVGFGLGQCIPIVRGAGLEQVCVEELQEKLASKAWCHVFCEGQCNQSGAVMPFRWGVGRLVIHASTPPKVLPLVHTGMEHMFPEGKSKAFPRFTRLQVQVGDEVDVTDLWEKGQVLLRRQDASDDAVREQLEQLYAEVTNRVEQQVRGLYADASARRIP